MVEKHERGAMDRRSVLRMAVSGIAIGGLAAAGLPQAAQAHGLGSPINRIRSPYDDLFSYYTYENGRPKSYAYNSGFYARLQAWIDFHWSNAGHLPAGYFGTGVQLHAAGVHVDKNIEGTNTPSMHTYGRAMDITALRAPSTSTGSLITLFDANWNNTAYWATVASLEYHFREVVHREDNATHRNHVHVDNGKSGSGNSTFTTGSSSQIKFAQAACTFVWGLSTGIDGGYGTQTKASTSKVLTRIGRSGYLHDSQGNWLAFCLATFRKGTGKQSY